MGVKAFKDELVSATRSPPMRAEQESSRRNFWVSGIQLNQLAYALIHWYMMNSHHLAAVLNLLESAKHRALLA